MPVLNRGALALALHVVVPDLDVIDRLLDDVCRDAFAGRGTQFGVDGHVDKEPGFAPVSRAEADGVVDDSQVFRWNIGHDPAP